MRLLVAAGGITLIFNTLIVGFTLLLSLLNMEEGSGTINPLAIGFDTYTNYFLIAIYVVVFILTAATIASEFNNRTLGTVIVSHNRRVEFVLSKFILILLIASLMPLLSWLILGVISAALVLSDPSIAMGTSWFESLAGSVLFVLRSILGIAMFTAVAVLVAILTKSMIFTVGTGILWFFGSVIVRTLLGFVNFEQFLYALPDEWVNLWLARSGLSTSQNASAEDVLSISLQEVSFGGVVLLVTVATLALAAIIFSRRDIKE